MGLTIPTPGGGDESGGGSGSGFPLNVDTDVGGVRLTNLADPIDAQDAATLASVQAIALIGTQALAAHAVDTTAVHGIADTSLLLDTADIGVTVQAYDPDLADIAAIADAQGDILVRGAAGWERLAKSGTATHVLTAGASQPSWAAPASPALTPWTSNIDADAYSLTDLGQVGIGTQGLTANTGVQIGRTLTGLSTAHYGFYSLDNLSFTSPTLFHAYAAFRSQPTIAVTAGALTSLYGLYHAPTVSGAGAVTQATGAYYGLVSNGTVTTGYGIQIGSTAGTGTIGTMVGLEMLNLAAGTTKWGMQIGAYQSYHEGKFRIGALSPGSTTAPAVVLDVCTYPALSAESMRISSFNAIHLTKESVYQNGQSTSNATPAAQTILAMTSSVSLLIVTNVVARRSGGVSGSAEDSAGYVLTTLVKNAAGTATKVGTTIQTVVGESVAGWDATHVVSGGNVQLQFTGAATTDIKWYATSRVYEAP